MPGGPGPIKFIQKDKGRPLIKASFKTAVGLYSDIFPKKIRLVTKSNLKQSTISESK